MKILITGNMGYVGPVVVSELRRSYPDATLIGYDIGYFSQFLTNAHMFPECKLDIQFFGDVRNFSANVLSGVDIVVHLAAISNDPIGNKYEETTLDINYHSSVDIAKKCKAGGVKHFIFASSCSVYGFTDDSPKTERSQLNPLTAYAKSKIYTEKALEKLADTNFKITCLRFATACGMSERLRLDLVLNDFVAAAVASRKIIILSDGTPWRPLIHVRDMAKAIDWATKRDTSQGGEYLVINIGSNVWNYRVKDLAKAVSKLIPGTEVIINKDASPDRRSYKVNFDLFRTLAPNHQPQYNLEKTIIELKEGLEAIGFKDKDFRNSNFMRLNALHSLREKNFLNEKLMWIFPESVKA